jgi:hypothetical protein
MLTQEARALLTRLARVKPFALLESMVPAAAVSLPAQVAIESALATGRHALRSLVNAYLRWLQSPAGHSAPPSEAQRRFTFLRLRFNTMLTQFDLFADVLTQRSEHDTGVWLSGLDVVAADALTLSGDYYDIPPVICYLDRGPGAAIRRARTRLPGGDENPVAVIRVPRERMIGAGIASSLIHEVGHQGAALLDLVNSLRPILQGLQRSNSRERLVWGLWERWISEILADFWSVAKVGIASTFGLVGVVSLPRAFVFRMNVDDPHPIPWIRVKLSCAIGRALYPHPQWDELAQLWEAFYPLNGLDDEQRHLLAALEASMAGFVTLVVSHRPKTLRGIALHEALATEDRHPHRLTAYFRSCQSTPQHLRTLSPSLAFAVIGQARANGQMSPEAESETLTHLLTHWALRSTLDRSVLCTTLPTMTRSMIPTTV